MISEVTIIGYSLDAVLEAIRRSTSPDIHVTLMATAPLGSPLDTYDDCVSSRYADVITELSGGVVEFEEFTNPRYIYLPYSSVKITNRHNGVMQFPFSKKTFDDEQEWRECAEAMNDRVLNDALADLSLPPTKILSALKSCMPQKFSDTFIKAMGNTRWRDVRIARLSMQGYKYEYPLEFMTNSDYNEYYCRPSISYNKICKILLKRFGIEYKEIPLETAGAIIKDNTYLGNTVIMDNRVDQLVDYIGGRFERQRIYPIAMRVPHNLEFAGDGMFYTPLSTCWAVSIFNGKAKRFMSEVVETLYDTEITEIPSTKANIKLYDTYVHLIKQFGNKELLLGQRVETLIK